jgi:hypothetical protein
MSANTQAIKLDHNRLSCPTPSKNVHVKKSKRLVRLIQLKKKTFNEIFILIDFSICIQIFDRNLSDHLQNS